MATREAAGSDAGFFLAAKGGHNQESHNHNDVGQYVVFLDGQPLLVDPGVETYTQKTFSDRRYEIWTMQSGFHNLPSINGVVQQAGRAFRARDVAYSADDAEAALTLDIAGAYPPAVNVTRWLRTTRLHRDGTGVEITEDVTLAAPAAVALHLITAAPPQLDAPGTARLTPAAVLRYPEELHATVEELLLTDPQLQGVWGEKLYRIVLTADGVQNALWKFHIERG